MDEVVDVHIEYEVALLEVDPTPVKGQGWCHRSKAMYGMIKGVTTM